MFPELTIIKETDISTHQSTLQKCIGVGRHFAAPYKTTMIYLFQHKASVKWKGEQLFAAGSNKYLKNLQRQKIKHQFKEKVKDQLPIQPQPP